MQSFPTGRNLGLLIPLFGALFWGVARAEQGWDGARQRRLDATARAVAPPGFAYIPGGPCRLGSDDPDADSDVPPERVRFLPGFYLSRTEVTNAEYQRFRPQFHFPPGRERYPVTNLTRAEATAYCRWRGGLLPTEQQWEKAARGTDGRRYPWGNAWRPGLCNIRSPKSRDAGLRPVGSYPASDSPYGVQDMAGNAWEWVADSYDGDPERGVIRGGAHAYFERTARTYARGIEGRGVT